MNSFLRSANTAFKSAKELEKNLASVGITKDKFMGKKDHGQAGAHGIPTDVSGQSVSAQEQQPQHAPTGAPANTYGGHQTILLDPRPTTVSSSSINTKVAIHQTIIWDHQTDQHNTATGNNNNTIIKQNSIQSHIIPTQIRTILTFSNNTTHRHNTAFPLPTMVLLQADTTLLLVTTRTKLHLQTLLHHLVSLALLCHLTPMIFLHIVGLYFHGPQK